MLRNEPSFSSSGAFFMIAAHIKHSVKSRAQPAKSPSALLRRYYALIFQTNECVYVLFLISLSVCVPFMSRRQCQMEKA